MKTLTKKNKAVKQLKLFVWDDFWPDYTSGLAFAIATTEKEARKMISKDRSYYNEAGLESYWGKLSVYPLTKKISFRVSGGS